MGPKNTCLWNLVLTQDLKELGRQSPKKNSICKDQGWGKELILHQGNKIRSEWVECVNKGRMKALRGEVAEGGSLGKALEATF